jgi:hypothetical protein
MGETETRCEELVREPDGNRHEETRLSDAELIRLADAYTINMLDDPRPLPGDDAAIEHSTRVFLRYMRERGYAHAEHLHLPPVPTAPGGGAPPRPAVGTHVQPSGSGS